MRKINYLLHPVTVINFLLIAKLALRYRWVTLAACAAFLGSVPYLYYRQAVVSIKQVHFRVYTQETGANVAVNANEVFAQVNSYDFGVKMAGHLATAPHFQKLDFSHPTDMTNNAQKVLGKCPNQACRTQLLKGAVGLYFTVNPEAAPGRFQLKVSTRNPETTIWVVESFQKALHQSRQMQALQRARDQVKQLQELVVDKRAEIEARDGFEKSASAEFLNAMIIQHNDKIRGITSRLLNDDSQSFTQGARLQESNLASDVQVDGREKLKYETYDKLTKRVEELRQNVAAINSLPESARTPTDATVLSQLQTELAKGQAELRTFGRVRRNLSLDATFLSQQKGSKSSLEYDFRVSSAQVRKLKSAYEAAKAELDALYNRKAGLDNELLTLKPDMEHLKMLEVRLAEAKFRESAVNSDVQFEPYGPEVERFKRSSLLKLAAFSFLIILFFLINFLVVFYLFDDRIFDPLEIEMCMDDLPIVGYAPYFD